MDHECEWNNSISILVIVSADLGYQSIEQLTLVVREHVTEAEYRKTDEDVAALQKRVKFSCTLCEQKT